MEFKQKKGGGLNLVQARKVVEKLLNDYPAFRSQDSNHVCLNIGHYFRQHPIIRMEPPATPIWQEVLDKTTPENSSSPSSPPSPNNLRKTPRIMEIRPLEEQ